MYLVDVNSLM